MDNTEQAFARIAAEIGTLASPPTRWQRTVAGARDALIVLSATAAVIGLFGVIGAVARVGWNMAGGVGW